MFNDCGAEDLTNMQPFSKPITEIIKQRYSCRSYLHKPILENHRWLLESFIASTCCKGPLGTHPRFGLIAALEDDSRALRGLGTYGFIKNPTGFIVGVVRAEEKNLEDFGYLMETAILYATDLGLGTCWLGGSFTRSNFIERFPLARAETMPAVVATGYPLDGSRTTDLIRQRAGSDERLAWDSLFFDGKFGQTLNPEKAGVIAEALENVRLAPSASNKQPWRVIKDEGAWHFYLQRTRGYGAPSPLFKMMRLADLQRVDIGIAMCHFDLSARQLRINGKWEFVEPSIARMDELCEYVVSWIPVK
jgi:nitroreductase